MDYYRILGVNKNASQDEIRKAYKKQSMKHHPDRGGDESEFKKINEAYQTLSNEQKRAEYDNPQPQYRFHQRDFRNGNPFGANGFEDLFSQFGFRGQQQRAPQKNKDVQLSYTIDLADCYTGKNTTISYRIPSGKQETLDVRIPPGIKNGDVVRVEGYGDDTIRQLPRGSLLIRINLKIPHGWDVDGLDLITSKRVSVFDLITGTEILVDTPEGKTINLKIPAGSQSPTTFSVNGYGLPRGGSKGKIYVKVFGDIPKVQDQDLLNKIKELKTSLAG